MPGDYFRLFWDNGTGTIDTANPVVDKIAIWPGQKLGPVEDQQSEDGTPVDSKEENLYTSDNSLADAGFSDQPAGKIEIFNRNLKAGLYKFALAAVDIFENILDSSLWYYFQIWICEVPESPKNFRLDSYDKANDRITFTFSPSRSF